MCVWVWMAIWRQQGRILTQVDITPFRCMESVSREDEGRVPAIGTQGNLRPSPRVSPVTVSDRPEFTFDSDSDPQQGKRNLQSVWIFVLLEKNTFFFILNMILLIVDPFNDSGLSPTKKASDFFLLWDLHYSFVKIYWNIRFLFASKNKYKDIMLEDYSYYKQKSRHKYL